MGRPVRRSVLFACVLGGVVACAGADRPERIVLVVVDTLRRDALGCYGGGADTPTIDRLAREGQRFARAVASFHQTTMSMGALFTGRTPSLESGRVPSAVPFHGLTWCGLARFGRSEEREECVPPGIPTLGERMRGAGYSTIGVTSNVLLFDPYGLSRGFDDWSEVGDVPLHGTLREIVESLDTRSAARVNAAVADALERRRSDRFFLYVHYMDVHDYQVQEVDEGRAMERARVRYRIAVGKVDRAIGELLALLDAENVLDGTVVVVTSDHGERLGERHVVDGWPSHTGNPSFREVLDVPLVVWPARFDDATSLVRGTDLHAMLLALSGVAEAPPQELEPGEVFTSELGWVTYQRGGFKSYTRRDDRGLWLVDLASDAQERRNVARDHPDVAREHWDRVGALARELAAPDASPAGPPERDAARLRALGYLEPADAPAPAEPAAPAGQSGRRAKRRAGAEPWRPVGPSRDSPGATSYGAGRR